MFQSFGRVLLSALFVMASALPFAAAATPDAVNDTVTVRKDTKTDINVVANDTGSSFGPGVVSVGAASNGTVKIIAGKIQYTPNPGFTGSDSFTYTVRDGLRTGFVQRTPARFVKSAENSGKGDVVVQGSGWGSALTAGPTSDSFYLMTDRGPNADGSSSINKTFPVPDFNPRVGLFQRQGDGTYALKELLPLQRANGTLITGLPNPTANPALETATNVGGVPITFQPPGGNAGQDIAGLDTEGLAFDPVRGGFWICDEYGPQIVHFDGAGKELERLNPLVLNAQGRKLPRILQTRRANRGMEGLCITPSGLLVGMMQNALNITSNGNAATNAENNITTTVRIVRYNPNDGNTEQFIYLLDNTHLTDQIRVSEIACIDDNRFLVLERDDALPGPSGPYKILYEIDLSKSLDTNGNVVNTAPTNVGGGRDETTGALIPYAPTNAESGSDPGTTITRMKKWRLSDGSGIDTLEKLCRSKSKDDALDILLALTNPVSPFNAEPVRPVAKTVFLDYGALLGDSFPHSKAEGLFVLAKDGSGDPTKIVLVNDDDFGIGDASGNNNDITTNINSIAGVQSFNQIVEIDLTTASTDTATVTVNVVSQSPYLVDVADGVQIKPLFTVGDSVNRKLDGVTPYRFVGVPDGLGAFDNSDGTFTLLMNHELGSTAGIERAHGSKGAFVSRWIINKSTMGVQSIQDFATTSNANVFTWNTTTSAYNAAGTTAFERLCSADLPPASAFFGGGLGTQNRIFLSGEETAPPFAPFRHGRLFGWVATGPDSGKVFELPRLGDISWENALACPVPQVKTIVAGMDDAANKTTSTGAGAGSTQDAPSELYFYIGTKQATGNDIEKAGLTNGKLFGLKVTGVPEEGRTGGTLPVALGAAKGSGKPFTLVDLGNVQNDATGLTLQASAIANGVTQFLRVEDGQWDPNNPKVFYFVTTDQFDQLKNVTIGTTIGRSRLWRVNFTDIANPEQGGTITMLIDGSENPGPQMMDNITIDKQNRILIQEDPGQQHHSASIWSYSIQSGSLTRVARHDPAKFGDISETSIVTATSPFDRDEESSGIIDVSDILGQGWFLFDSQAHRTTSAVDTELAELGQLLAMFVPSSIDEESPSNESPYIVPVANGVKTKAIFSVGESANLKPDGITPYRMVGIPDGLGAFDNNDGTLTLAMHHELATTQGIVRAHGSKGAFISTWNINKSTLQVNSIVDHNPNNTSIFTSTNGNGTIGGTALYGRFCSADLPAPSAFFNVTNGKGSTERIFMGGEENGNEGRAFAHILTGVNKGKSYELPRLGKFSWENSIACPTTQDKTIVVGTDDSTPGQVYIYIGSKGMTGTEVDKAGLTNGLLYGVLANSTAAENQTTGIGLAKGVSGPFTLFNLGDVSALVATPTNPQGAQLEALSNAASVTKFLRPEDGAWDPNNPTDFYFVTTDQFDQTKNGGLGTTIGRSRLWRLRFANILTPETGGTITMLIDGSENPGPNMMDNLTVDRFGRILLQEDPGAQNHCARIWMYTIATGTLIEIAKHDPARFGDVVNGAIIPATAPFNNDEESSGIIDAATLLGDGWYLLDVQAHAAHPDAAELVQYGQLLAMFVPPVLSPSISPIADQITNEDTATGAIPFTVTAGSFAITTVTAVSSNKTLVPDASAVVAGTTQSRTITLTPAANQNGITTITVTATDAGGQSVSTSFTLTVQPVPDLPVITSAASATPNPAGPTQTITFTIAATGAQSIEWNFGDGTPVGSGALVTHAYTAEGVFNVIVKVTGTEGISTSNVTVIIANESNPTGGQGDFDGDGVSNDLDDDDDNDGYSDKIETAMGGNPLNATVTPGNKPAITAANTVAPRMVKLSIKLAFTTNGDALTLSGILPGSTGASDVIVDVGGNVQSFTLTKGKSPKDKSKSLSLAKDKLTMKLNKVTLAPDFADEGLIKGDFAGEIVNIGVSVIANGKLFEAELSKEYSAKGGKGSVK